MSVIDCIKQAGVTNKELLDIAKKYAKEPDKMVKRLTEVSEAAQLRINQTKLQKEAVKRIKGILATTDTNKGKRQLLQDMMTGSGVRGLGVTSLENDIKAVLGPVHRQLTDMMEAYRPKKGGFSRSKTGQEDMLRAVFGEEVLDVDARAFAKAWIKVIDQLVDRFNKVGGGIIRLKDWNLPNAHDSVKISQSTFEEWYAFTRPKLKGERIVPFVSEKTGKEILSEEREAVIRNVLESVYNSLSSDGVIKIDTSGLTPFLRRKIGNRHQEHRLLHWKDGDSYLAYANKYGAQDHFNNMMGYAELMAREIAAMEKFGPHADAVVEGLARQVTGKKSSLIQDSYNEIMGKNYGMRNKLSDTMQAIRNMIVATKIGTALIPAMSDTFFTALTAAYRGMPILKTTFRQMRGLVPSANKEDRILLNKLQFLGEYAINRATGANRISEVWGYGATARLADATTRLSGLDYWTQTSKDTFKLSTLEHLGRLSEQGYDVLPRRFKAALEGYGIDSADWAKMQASPKYSKGDLNFLDISTIDDVDLTKKIVNMVNEESHFAVPEPNAKSRALLHMGTIRGTVAGEIMRFAGQFKSFPVAILTTHFHRGLAMSGISRLTYLGSLVAGTTALGMMVVQAKDMLRGKTPREVSPELVRDGLLQGGSLGLLGDMLINDPTSFGGIAEQILGPAASEGASLLKILHGTASDAMEGEKEILDRLRGQGVRYLEKWVPGQMWYTKLALERFVFDQINKTVDPNWYKRQRQMTRQMRRERSQEWWSEPGSLNF